jgi:hypothetical protein
VPKRTGVFMGRCRSGKSDQHDTACLRSHGMDWHGDYKKD